MPEELTRLSNSDPDPLPPIEISEDEADVLTVLKAAGEQQLSRVFVIGVLPNGDYYAAGSGDHEQCVTDAAAFLRAAGKKVSK